MIVTYAVHVQIECCQAWQHASRPYIIAAQIGGKLMDDLFHVDPTPDGPDKEANEKALQQKLADYQKALEEEWASSEKYKEGQLPPTEIRAKTKELLTQAIPKAVASLLQLSQHAQAENVRLKAAMYIVDKGIGREAAGMVGDPMEELLKELNQQ
jgi:hypothetical protein